MNPNEQPNVAPTPVATPTPAPAPEPVAQPAPQPPQPTPQPFQQGISTPTYNGSTPITPEPTPVVDAPTPPAPNPEPVTTPTPATTAPTEVKAPTYDEYLDGLVKDLKPVELPKPTDVDQNDPEGLVKFFQEYGEKITQQAAQEMQKQSVIQNAEASAWQEVFTKYPEVKDDKQLRDTIHNIRMGAYSRGDSFSPIQVADQLVGSLHERYYKQGVNDTNVQTKVVDSQPLNGGGQPQPQSPVDYEALQAGGRDAAVNQIQQMIDSGRI